MMHFHHMDRFFLVIVLVVIAVECGQHSENSIRTILPIELRHKILDIALQDSASGITEATILDFFGEDARNLELIYSYLPFPNKKSFNIPSCFNLLKHLFREHYYAVCPYKEGYPVIRSIIKEDCSFVQTSILQSYYPPFQLSLLLKLLIINRDLITIDDIYWYIHFFENNRSEYNECVLHSLLFFKLNDFSSAEKEKICKDCPIALRYCDECKRDTAIDALGRMLFITVTACPALIGVIFNAARRRDISIQDFINWQGLDGEIPLGRVVLRGSCDQQVVECLLKNGANPCIKNISGYSVLDNARILNIESMVKVLDTWTSAAAPAE